MFLFYFLQFSTRPKVTRPYFLLDQNLLDLNLLELKYSIKSDSVISDTAPLRGTEYIVARFRIRS